MNEVKIFKTRNQNYISSPYFINEQTLESLITAANMHTKNPGE